MNTNQLAEPVASSVIPRPQAVPNLSSRVSLCTLMVGAMLTEGCTTLGISDPSSLLVPRLHRSEIVGIVAGFGTTFAGLPDLMTMLKQRSNAGINPKMAAILAVFQVLWVYYGLLIASRPVIVWNVLGVVINSVIVWSYFRFGRKSRPVAAKSS
jgi:uncharacterized protein with PQ loop repeat